MNDALSSEESSRPPPSLIEAKVRALARTSTGLELAQVDGVRGSGLSTAEGAEVEAFYLATGDPRAVGRALHWATSQHAARLHLLAETDGEDLARRAGLLTPRPGPDPGPAVSVWNVDGAEATPATPRDLPERPTIPERHWSLAAVISEAGARPVDDHGVLIAEVAGLEVGRVVDGDDGPTIEVGVGQADRELSQMVHRDDDLGEGLRRVIAAVIEFRRAGSHHPLTRVGRERWLRSLLMEDPDLVGAASLQPLVPLRPRGGLRLSAPSAAAGVTSSGEAIVVVAMIGVDLDLIPEAADYRQGHDPDAEVVLVMPERDLKLSSGLLDRLPSASAVAVETPWL